MRIAILGASGFLGRHMMRSLLGQGHEVIGFALHVSAYQDADIQFMTVAEFQGAPSMSRPVFDVVINVAARRSTKDRPLADTEVREFTYLIPREFILQVANPQSLVVNTSTYIQNFEGIEGRSVDSYGAAKQELSEFLQQNSRESMFRTIDIFLFTLYGQGDHPNHLLPGLLEAAKSGREISLSPGHQLINLINVDDVVANVSRCLEMESPNYYTKYYLWEEKYLSVRELVTKIESTTGTSLNCLWGSRQYAGHEMFEPWKIPMPQLPQMELQIPLEEGIKRLWVAR